MAFSPQQSHQQRNRRISEIRTANQFLHLVSGNMDLDVEDIDSALEWAERETASFDLEMKPALKKLLEWYLQDHPQLNGYLIEAPTEYSPGSLWLNHSLEDILQSLPDQRPLVLLVAGLKEFAQSPGRRWSKSARIAFEEMTRHAEDKVIAFSQSSGIPVSLLIS